MRRPKSYLSLSLSFFLIFLMIVSSISIDGFKLIESPQNTIHLEYVFSPPSITQQKIDNQTYDFVQIPGTSLSAEPGQPRLPIQSATILLPANSILTDISCSSGETISLGQGFRLQNAGYPVPLSTDENRDVPRIYESSASDNKSPFTVIGTYGFRGYQLLVLQLKPIRYDSDGSLHFTSTLQINIQTSSTDKNLSPLYRGSYEDYLAVQNRVDNPEQLQSYPFPSNHKRNVGASAHHLLIITTDQLKQGFVPLQDTHESQGLRTSIVSLEELNISTPAEIRAYITEAYQTQKVDYVLLGGDIDQVPPQLLYVESASGGDVAWMPSDFYFGCLDGTFNYDNDDKWGEPTDGENGGDVDLVAEVYVGRASVDNLTEVGHFVNKTITYLTVEHPCLSKVLQVGEDLGFIGVARWGGNHMDDLIDFCDKYEYTTIGIPSEVYGIDKLYDRDWEGYSWPVTELIERINDNVLLLNHLGHAYYETNMKLNPQRVREELDNEYPCFIYSQGCMAGGFDFSDESDCMAEWFTVKTAHAAFAGIWNARYGWGRHGTTDGASQRYHREFYDAIFGESILSLGHANQDSKEDNLYRINSGVMRWVYYGLNLFGDPTLTIEISAAPDTPSLPDGPGGISVERNHTFSTSAVSDPDGDDVSYLFDWGDGTTSDWVSEPVASHFWKDQGVYSVRVKARDSFGVQSEWSSVKNVTVTSLLFRIKTTPVKIIGEVINMGEYDVSEMNLSLCIEASDGILLYPRRPKTTSVFSLPCGDIASIETYQLGLGGISLRVFVGCENETASAFSLGPIIFK